MNVKINEDTIKEDIIESINKISNYESERKDNAEVIDSCISVFNDNIPSNIESLYYHKSNDTLSKSSVRKMCTQYNTYATNFNNTVKKINTLYDNISYITITSDKVSMANTYIGLPNRIRGKVARPISAFKNDNAIINEVIKPLANKMDDVYADLKSAVSKLDDMKIESKNFNLDTITNSLTTMIDDTELIKNSIGSLEEINVVTVRF